jgi:hypothetical protein
MLKISGSQLDAQAGAALLRGFIRLGGQVCFAQVASPCGRP